MDKEAAEILMVLTKVSLAKPVRLCYNNLTIKEGRRLIA